MPAAGDIGAPYQCAGGWIKVIAAIWGLASLATEAREIETARKWIASVCDAVII